MGSGEFKLGSSLLFFKLKYEKGYKCDILVIE